jgi:hypothetical protein
MLNTATYTIERLQFSHFLDNNLVGTLVSWAREVSDSYGGALGAEGFRPAKYLNESGGVIVLARRNGVPVGVICARLLESVLDRNVTILYQDLLYVTPGIPKAVKLLIEWLIDMGRRNADHIITMIAAKTNLKPRSLERLGFEKLETLYRMRVE